MRLWKLWEIPPEGIKCIPFDEAAMLREVAVDLIPWGSHYFMSDCGAPCGMPIAALSVRADVTITVRDA